jgi:hypothetical protein
MSILIDVVPICKRYINFLVPGTASVADAHPAITACSRPALSLLRPYEVNDPLGLSRNRSVRAIVAQ